MRGLIPLNSPLCSSLPSSTTCFLTQIPHHGTCLLGALSCHHIPGQSCSVWIVPSWGEPGLPRQRWAGEMEVTAQGRAEMRLRSQPEPPKPPPTWVLQQPQRSRQSTWGLVGGGSTQDPYAWATLGKSSSAAIAVTLFFVVRAISYGCAGPGAGHTLTSQQQHQSLQISPWERRAEEASMASRDRIIPVLPLRTGRNTESSLLFSENSHGCLDSSKCIYETPIWDVIGRRILPSWWDGALAECLDLG